MTTFKIGKTAVFGIILISIIMIGINSLKIIETGNVGVKSTLGQIEKNELKPGLNFAIPMFQKIEPVFTKTIMVNYTGSHQKPDTEELYSEATLQGEDETGLELGIDLLVEVNPVMNQMADMFIAVGRQGFEKKVLQPIRGVSRKVMGQFKAELIMKQRKQVEEMLRKELKLQFEKNPFFELVNVQLKKIYLPIKVKNAIERVALAKQSAKEKQELIVSNSNLAKSKVVLAKGDADSREIRAAGLAKAAVLAAKGKAEAMVLKATAKAKVIKLEADARAKANKEISKSLTEKLIKQNSVEAWQSGGAKVPQFVGSNSQFIYDIGKVKK
jgi:regulator of protease activity HflC (stomatin/prohibitin superfamily)